MICLDSSFIVNLFHNKRKSAHLVDWLNQRRGRPLDCSALAAVELPRAVRRCAPEALPGLPAVMARPYLLEIDAIVRETALELPVTSLRSLDAIHVASTLVLQAAGPALEALVGYDERPLRGAAYAELPVLSPGMARLSGGL